jgi:membrane-bound lytic murein transglycosylase B
MKPRFLIDIKHRKSSRLNLNFQPVVTIPLKLLVRTFFIPLIIFSFIFGSVAAPTSGGVLAAQSDNEKERKALESQLAELENEISQYETKIENYRKQGKNLQTEIKKLEAQITKLNLQIRAINLTLSKLDEEIGSTQAQINRTESDIDFNKKNLSQILQTLYENDNKSLVEILFKNPQLSDFFTDLNNLLAVQDNLRLVIAKIAEAHQKLVDQKEVLALERADATALKAYQDSQKASIQKTQTEKGSLLKFTKGKESEYQKLLTETKKTAAEIRKRIFQLLGGGELEFDEAYKLAKFAERATGVRAALILAVLDRESALGKNVGQCDYKTAMHPTRDIPVFLSIIDELNLEKNLEAGIIKVSCPNADGAFGGAMGPAQFIPSTWKLYKDRVAEITGNNPPSPWRNADAFIATALYLKDAGAGPGASLANERKAAAKYYAGSRWSNYLWTYGARVIAQAQKFEEDISILSS